MCITLMIHAAGRDADVLIRGETGAGKELFARAIHANSARASRPFIVVDCASLPRTLAESILFGHARGAFTGAVHSRDDLVRQAHGGTLFLEEVGELPSYHQRTFLRVLQERRYRPVGAEREVDSDFRLVSATNRDLEAAVDAGRFRRDLLFRLGAFVIELPPSRDRGRDIDEIAAHYVGEKGAYALLTEHRTETGENTVLPYVVSNAKLDIDEDGRGKRLAFNFLLVGSAVAWFPSVVCSFSQWSKLDVGRFQPLVSDEELSRMGPPQRWPKEARPRGRLCLDWVR